MKIYTKVGDRGNTSLYDGSKVSKDSEIINCIGNIDELNSEFGCIIAHIDPIAHEGLHIYKTILVNVQS